MAEFCNFCTEKMFGKEVTPDIDVHAIAESLEPDTYQAVLCEGCGLEVVSKTKDGVIKVGGSGEKNEEGFVKLMSYEEYIKQFAIN